MARCFDFDAKITDGSLPKVYNQKPFGTSKQGGLPN